MIRILVADDDALVRSGLSLIIESAEDISVVGEAETGNEAVELTRRLQPDIVLMDVEMPGQNGIEATHRITELPGCDTRVIVVTTFELDRYVFDALRAGASGYLLKRSRPDQLLDAIRTVAEGDAQLSPSVTRRLVDELANDPRPPELDGEVDRLTEREREVLVQVAHGLSNQEIANELHISESTAKTHLKRVLMKLGLRDRVGAVVFAYEAGVIRPGNTVRPPPADR